MNLTKLTCTQDTSTSPSHSWAVSTTPDRSTVKYNIVDTVLNTTMTTATNKKSLMKVLNQPTWTCLQSCPRAGSWMRRKVMGHFRDTLMAVCSTPSSPFSVVLPAEAATLLKFLLTKEKEICFRWGRERGRKGSQVGVCHLNRCGPV